MMMMMITLTLILWWSLLIWLLCSISKPNNSKHKNYFDFLSMLLLLLRMDNDKSKGSLYIYDTFYPSLKRKKVHKESCPRIDNHPHTNIEGYQGGIISIEYKSSVNDRTSCLTAKFAYGFSRKPHQFAIHQIWLSIEQHVQEKSTATFMNC